MASPQTHVLRLELTDFRGNPGSEFQALQSAPIECETGAVTIKLVDPATLQHSAGTCPKP